MSLNSPDKSSRGRHLSRLQFLKLLAPAGAGLLEACRPKGKTTSVPVTTVEVEKPPPEETLQNFSSNLYTVCYPNNKRTVEISGAVTVTMDTAGPYWKVKEINNQPITPQECPGNPLDLDNLSSLPDLNPDLKTKIEGLKNTIIVTDELVTKPVCATSMTNIPACQTEVNGISYIFVTPSTMDSTLSHEVIHAITPEDQSKKMLNHIAFIRDGNKPSIYLPTQYNSDQYDDFIKANSVKLEDAIIWENFDKIKTKGSLLLDNSYLEQMFAMLFEPTNKSLSYFFKDPPTDTGRFLVNQPLTLNSFLQLKAFVNDAKHPENKANFLNALFTDDWEGIARTFAKAIYQEDDARLGMQAMVSMDLAFAILKANLGTASLTLTYDSNTPKKIYDESTFTQK